MQITSMLTRTTRRAEASPSDTRHEISNESSENPKRLAYRDYLSHQRRARATQRLVLLAILIFICPLPKSRAEIFRVTYAGSDEPSSLKLDSEYTLWIPESNEPLRALIVHQHGCGFAANAAGKVAALDLHWQSLARKWNAGLLGPHYKQVDQGREPCHLWSDPRKGSRRQLLQALDDFAKQADRPEINTVPWCLWGHSGGASWVSVMQTLDSNRIVAAWLRSGTAFPMWESGEYAPVTISESVYRIPTMLNPGIKESVDGRPVAAWLGSVAMFKSYREKKALISFAADPLSGHDCGDSRYLAIPFFDTCLAMRLPDKSSSSGKLKEIDLKESWLGDLMGRNAVPHAEYSGRKALSVWLPDDRFAKLWSQYVVDGSISDNSPPPAPFDIIARRDKDQVKLAWNAHADFESGLAGFRIYRNGALIAKLPEKPIGKFGRPLFQTMSFHDTPESPIPEMTYVDKLAIGDKAPLYTITAINSVGLESQPTRASD